MPTLKNNFNIQKIKQTIQNKNKHIITTNTKKYNYNSYKKTTKTLPKKHLT